MNNLEKQVKDLIECLYNCVYDADLKIEKEGNLYILTLYLNDQPHAYGGTVLSSYCESDEEFLEFLKQQLKKNRLDWSRHTELRIYHNDEIII